MWSIFYETQMRMKFLVLRVSKTSLAGTCRRWHTNQSSSVPGYQIISSLFCTSNWNQYF